MAKKCNICGNKIDYLFLEKIRGTYVNKKPVCSECQKKHQDKLKEKVK